MSIWNNQRLPEKAKCKYLELWKKASILFLSQLYDNDALQLFDKLAEKYNLSNKQFFQYLQLWHALQSQAKTFILKYNP